MEMLWEWYGYLPLGISTIMDALGYPDCLYQADVYDTLECLIWLLDTLV